MKILHLTLKKKWFDLIASGEKKHEFRESKPYWDKRLTDGNVGKDFDIVRFKNGYGDVPTIDVEFKGISFSGPKLFTPKHGEKIWPETIVISLGKVLSNVQKPYNRRGYGSNRINSYRNYNCKHLCRNYNWCVYSS